MALLARFFKPKWQHENPDIRRQALSGLTHTEQLLSFIDREMLTELRQQAVQQLQAADALETLLQHSHQDVREQARRILLQRLLPNDGNLQQINNDQHLVQIAVLTDDHATRLAAIGEIRNEQTRLDIAMNNPVAKVRLAAAEGIQASELLQQLLQHAQSKDKALYRLCKTRLSELKEAQAALTEQQQRFEQFLTQLNYLNKVGYNPEFYGRLQLLQQDWHSFEPLATTSQRAEIEQQLAAAQAILAEHAAIERAREEQQQREVTALTQQQQCLAQLHAWLSEPESFIDANATDALESVSDAWQQANDLHPATRRDAQLFEQGHQTLQRMLTVIALYQQQQHEINTWLQTEPANDVEPLRQQQAAAQQWLSLLAWPTTDAQPTWLRDIQRHADRVFTQRQQLANEQQQHIQQLEQCLRELERALDQGQIKLAEKHHQQATQALQALPTSLASTITARVKLLSARLYELRDWQGFVTSPKQEALCEAMEALVGADLDPELIAAKVQALQEEWKQLGAKADQATWQRFKQAADAAFEPCRTFFAERNSLRQQWVAARQALTAQLNEYEQQLDWSKADWGAVQKTLEAARATFRQYSPVDRQAHQTTQADFNAVCDRIYAHIKEEYDRNVLTKQQLIEQVSALLAHDDLTQAANQVKSLQQAWKAVGPIPRHVDQKLWRQFRQACDAIFARLDAQRQARKDDIEQDIERVQTRLEAAQNELQTALEQGQINIAEQHLQALRNELSSVRLPRAIQQQVQGYLDEWQRDIQQAHTAQQREQAQRRWQGLFDRLQALQHQDHALWGAATELPSGYDVTAFESAWQNRAARDQNDDKARALCVQMEILANLDSPDEDMPLRMTLQVQRLAEQLGNQRTTDSERYDLILTWLTIAASDQFYQRFMQALQRTL